MPSLITGIVGGIQSSHAAEAAGNVVAGQAKQVAGNINDATNQAIKFGQSGIDQSNADIQAMLQNTSGAVGAAVGNAGNWVNRGIGAATGAVNQGLSTATGALSPYVTAGQGGLSTLASMLGPGGSLITPLTASQVMANDPGYQFRLQQGQKALETSASARGGLLGGAATKAALQYGQGFASNEYGNSWNRLMQQRAQQYGMLSGLAGMGEQAGSTLTGAAMQGAGLLTNANMTGAGMMTNANMTGAGLLTNAGIAGANLGTNAALRGTEYMGSMGLAGTEAAGNMLMQGANATAQGIMGAQAGKNQMWGDIGGIGDIAMGGMLGGFGAMAGGGTFMGGMAQGMGLPYGAFGGGVSGMPGGVPAAPPLDWTGINTNQIDPYTGLPGTLT